MDSDRLKEIRNNLRALPALEERLAKILRELDRAGDVVAQLKKQYEAESQDVEQLNKETFTVSLLRMIGKYEGRLTKETREKLLAKTEYDQAVERVYQLSSERDELSGRITSLKIDRKQYEAELNARREDIEENTGSAAHARFSEIEGQLEMLARQLVETDEALRAASRLTSTADSALEHLDSADRWATYDVWTRGGILGHAAKYDSIDQAQTYLSRLDSQLKDLRRELSDVNLQDSISFTSIGSATRAVDFWFDNIFTDLNVRSVIRGNQEQVRSLCEKVGQVTAKLERNKTEIHDKSGRLEQDIEDLLLG